jgi:hypothetical protein
MSHLLRSIRQRLINGLGRIIDHLAEKPVQVLRSPEVHPETAGDLNNLVVVSVPYNAAERQIDHAKMLASFRQNIDVVNGITCVPNFQLGLAHRQVMTGLNHHFVAHQNAPFGKSYLPTLAAKKTGVES